MSTFRHLLLFSIPVLSCLVSDAVRMEYGGGWGTLAVWIAGSAAFTALLNAYWTRREV